MVQNKRTVTGTVHLSSYKPILQSVARYFQLQCPSWYRRIGSYYYRISFFTADPSGSLDNSGSSAVGGRRMLTLPPIPDAQQRPPPIANGSVSGGLPTVTVAGEPPLNGNYQDYATQR